MWTDQMLMYANVRRGSADYGGNSLDNVANIELDSEKRRYDGATVSVLNGAIEEYWNFVKYSINDVLLQYGIDKKTGDLDAVFDQSIYGGTRFTKTLKQSVYLKNVFATDYLLRDIVPGNNLNVNYIENKNEDAALDIELYKTVRPDGEDVENANYDDMQLPGALVGDPTLNMHQGVKLYGKQSNHMFEYVIDFDYTAK